MRFRQYEAFKRHIKEAGPNHLSQIYGIILPNPYERCLLEKEIINQPCEVRRFKEIKPFFEELHAFSFYSAVTVVILDGIENFSEKELLQMLNNLDPKKHVILGSAKPLSLFDILKKEMVTLDLSNEKPWERKARIYSHMKMWLQKEGKSADNALFDFLFQHFGSDLQSLEQELIKCTIYAGDAKFLALKEVLDAISSSTQDRTWKLSEVCIWGNAIPFAHLNHITKDLNALFPFLGKLRYQAELGLQLSNLIEQGSMSEEIQQRFPKLRNLEQLIAHAKKHSSTYFEQVLLHLFEWEYTLKNSPVRQELISHHFLGKIYDAHFISE